METTNPEVLDISSDDEEDCLGERGDWLSYLLEKEDSDEVVVVGSSICQEQSSKPSVRDDVDDDCLILDGDPDKPVKVANDTGSGASDELQIVSEKGQIACRDYPHPRHLCAKFPFSANPHEKYCDLCHCYVCDTLAPCIYWGTGVSRNDHCHSSDKEEVWRVHRKLARQGRTAALPPALPPKHLLFSTALLPPKHLSTAQAFHNTLSTAPPLHNKSIPALTVLQPLNNSNTQLHTHSNLNTLRACSTASNNSVLNITNQRNHQWSGDTLARNRVPHHGISSSTSLSPGSSNIVNNIIRRDKSSTLGPRFVSPHVNFKRVGSGVTTMTKNRSGHDSYDINNHGCNYTQQLQQQQLYLQKEILRSQELKVSQSASQQQQTNHHRAVSYNSIQDTRSHELNVCQSASQPTIGGGFMDSQPYSICMQPQVYSQPLPQLSENQITYLAENQAANVTNQNLPGIELDWVNDTVESLAPSAVNTEVLSVPPTSEPSPVIEHIPQCSGITNVTSADFDLDSWIQSLELRSDFETGRETLSTALGFVPSQAELAEAAVRIFDFENM